MSKKSTFFEDFKKFIMRGNVIDMAVGVIVGGAFTAVVNSMSNNILRPLINWILTLILGKDSLSEVYTFLQTTYKTDENGAQVIDLAESIYIDWGALINAIINFLLVATVLFAIVKVVNTLRDGQKKMITEIFDDIPRRADFKEMKKLKIKITDENIEKFMAEKKQRAIEEQERQKAEAEEKDRLERLANPTTEDLLKDILAELRKQ